jgi:hypothetical protein
MEYLLRNHENTGFTNAPAILFKEMAVRASFLLSSRNQISGGLYESGPGLGLAKGDRQLTGGAQRPFSATPRGRHK